MKKDTNLKSIRTLLTIFIACLFVSGLTAIPVHAELQILEDLLPPESGMGIWIIKVHSAYNQVNEQHPFLIYGYDWLAFAHFILAILFIGPLRDPIKNIWVIQFGLIACALVIPFAFIAGYFRRIPIGWSLIDCSFGILGFLLLSHIWNRIRRLSAIAKLELA